MPWDVVFKSLFILIVGVAVFAPVVTWVERKQSALMQDRIGANRADVFGIRILGLLHPLADVVKLITKEDVVPDGANRVMHLAAPMIAAVAAIISFAVIPYGASYTFGDTTVSLVAADIDWGLLYLFAVGSLAAYGTVIAGWASNNNWSLLGSLRASAQMISYEVTMGLSVVGVFMVFGTLRLTDMAFAQDTTFRLLGFVETFGWVDTLPAWLGWIRLPQWGVFLQPLGFVMFLAAIMAENKRPPFDLPEGESELVAGYHLEYSGMRFGLFFMAEFIEVVVIAAIMTTVFLGGWSIPWVSQAAIIGAIEPGFGAGMANLLCMVAHVLTWLVKVVIMIWLQMNLRWILPRFRYDQIMDLCWKIMLPLSIANAFVTGTILLLVEGGAVSFDAFLFYLFGALAVVSALAMLLNVRNTVAAAMSLAITMVALSGIYVLLQAHLVAVIQIMVYAGAIVVLFVFVVMLLNLRSDSFSPGRLRLLKVLGTGAGLWMLARFLAAQGGHLPETRALGEAFGGYRHLGRSLFTDYLLPFEMTSLLLLAAIVGAVILAKRRVDS